ncbi:MAG: AbgT family transporter [Geminicoccaceae bacterium]
MQRILDTVERVGNRVPHPVIIFVILTGIVIVLSHVFYMLGLTVSYQAINPVTHEVEDKTTVARSSPWTASGSCSPGSCRIS